MVGVEGSCAGRGLWEKWFSRPGGSRARGRNPGSERSGEASSAGASTSASGDGTSPRKDGRGERRTAAELLYNALRNAAYQSKVLGTKGSVSAARGECEDSSFLSTLLRGMRSIELAESGEGMQRIFRLVRNLPVPEQWQVLQALHEETLNLDEKGPLASTFLEYVKSKTGGLLFPGRSAPDQFSTAEVLKKLEAQNSKAAGGSGCDKSSEAELLPLLADIMVSHETETGGREVMRILTAMMVADSKRERQATPGWRKNTIEILLNMKFQAGYDGGQGGEISSLLLCHQDMSVDPAVLRGGASSTGCLLRVGTLVKCLEFFSKDCGERGETCNFPRARNHLLSILLMKLKAIFRGGKTRSVRDVAPLHPLGGLGTNMQGVFKEVLGTCFDYWNMPASLVNHSKAILSHCHHYEVVCERQIMSQNGSTDINVVPTHSELRLELAQNQSLEDKIVIICLVQECLKYLGDRGQGPSEMVESLRSALGKESLASLCKVASLLWQSNQGRNVWLASTRYFKSKPFTCLAVAFGVLLHFELSGASNGILISSIVQLLKELERFVRFETESSGSQKRPSYKLNQDSVYGMVTQILLLSSFLAVPSAPASVPPIFSCVFEYLRKDLEFVKSSLSRLHLGTPDLDFKRFSEVFSDLIQGFYKPLFQLEAKVGNFAKVPTLGDAFFESLFSVMELLLRVVGAPVRNALLGDQGREAAAKHHDPEVPRPGGGTHSKIQMTLGIAKACLEVLQVLLNERGPDLDQCSDKLKCKIERASMVFDYILAKFIHVMKLYKAGEKTSEMVGVGERDAAQITSGQAEVYLSVKEFVTKCIETFSIQKVKKRPADTVAKPPSERKTSKDSKQKSRVVTNAKQVRKTNKRHKRSSNAFIDAALRGEGYHAKEDGDLEDLEDLEDFIVCKPGRDYDKVLAKRTPRVQDAGKAVGEKRRKERGVPAGLHPAIQDEEEEDEIEEV